jgi:hypothetical protein
MNLCIGQIVFLLRSFCRFSINKAFVVEIAAIARFGSFS